jgi:hypothetical protein
MSVVEVGLAPSLAHRRAGLQELLGSGFDVESGTLVPSGVVILDEESVAGISTARAAAGDLGIIVLLEDHDDCSPRAVVSLIEAGADVCLVAPGLAGLAAHVRALAAHHPEHAPRACLA